MKNRLSLIALPILTFALTAPAVACDLHGGPGLGGFHRYNPFAAAMQGFDQSEPALEVPAEVAEVEAAAQRADAKKAKSKTRAERSEKADANAKTKSKPITPVAYGKSDSGRGSTKESNKATTI